MGWNKNPAQRELLKKLNFIMAEVEGADLLKLALQIAIRDYLRSEA